ncbi:alpha/beta fold hydrolase [Marinobacter salinisoli]|uniref:Alpha/beta fold hydrolase n=1 Tax=Marinobacter salinisoli TaxID=2769486 RepID=A0ABX7MNR3_9GAMM|nr:alpha/beta fold hydrolase [Marinobacter salinisoli]QSP93910.1 alpha/beta fold hydrolase [Marinobacter salinisoli]
MNFQLNLFQAAFGIYSRILPSRAAVKAVEWMTSPRIKAERRRLPKDLFSERIALPSGGLLATFGTGPKKMLLLHGWSGWVGQFQALISEIDPTEYTVYAVQPLGHGESNAPQSHPGRFIEAALETLDFVDAPFDVAVGHSLGAAALIYAQALRGDIKHLVLVSSPATIEGVLRRFARFLNLGDRSTSHFISAMEETVGLGVDRLDLVALAHAVSTPVLVIHDESDAEVPAAESMALQRAFSQSRSFRTNGLGHSRLLQHADVTREIMQFLDRDLP